MPLLSLAWPAHGRRRERLGQVADTLLANFGLPFVPATWMAESAAGRAWSGGVWNGAAWTGTGWESARWSSASMRRSSGVGL